MFGTLAPGYVSTGPSHRQNIKLNRRHVEISLPDAADESLSAGVPQVYQPLPVVDCVLGAAELGRDAGAVVHGEEGRGTGCGGRRRSRSS